MQAEEGTLDRPRVLIADEQPMARASARRLLEREGFLVCGEAADADAAVYEALREAPDVCVIDVLLPGDAVGAIAEITQRLPSTAVVVFTASEDRDRFFEAVGAGAVGYLLKEMDPSRLPHALRGVLAGEAAVPRTLVASLVSELRSRGGRRLVVGRSGRAELTAREWEVADLLASEQRTDAIADRLGVSPVTVRRHVSEILRKLGVKDRAEAARLLGDEGAGQG